MTSINAEHSSKVPELVMAKLTLAPSPTIQAYESSFSKSVPVKIPVTILTGFLGSGKSTLLGRLLREQHGWKVAVLLNEIGPTGDVDRAIINSTLKSAFPAMSSNDHANNGIELSPNASTNDPEWLKVENGCLCCTAKNETFLALETLLRRRPDLDHIVIEASGAADPTVLVQKLWVDEALESSLNLDGVVCVVDASAKVEDRLKGGEYYSVEMGRQLAIADVILLNKIDLVPSEAKLAAIEDQLTVINPLAKIIRTRFCQIPLNNVLHLDSYGVPIQKPPNSNNEKDEDPINRITRLLTRACQISNHPHQLLPLDRRIRSFTISMPHPQARHLFERRLFTLLWERCITIESDGDYMDDKDDKDGIYIQRQLQLHPQQQQQQFHLPTDDCILRVKGLITLITKEQKPPRIYYLQAVEEKYELEPLERIPPRDTFQLALIFIGIMSDATEEMIRMMLSNKNCSN